MSASSLLLTDNIAILNSFIFFSLYSACVHGWWRVWRVILFNFIHQT